MVILSEPVVKASWSITNEEKTGIAGILNDLHCLHSLKRSSHSVTASLMGSQGL
jgi:hypothetical protein